METCNAHFRRLRFVVNNYYRNFLFLFLPNVCNARCYFCYVNPSFSGSARIPPTTIRNLKRFVHLAHMVGFKEIRLTGGEPLVFENITEVINIMAENGMEYTLLTNGVNLENHVNHIVRHKPSKVTLSFHSIDKHPRIFGIKSNPYEILRSIRILLSHRINVAITILLLPENEKEVLHLIKYLTDYGIKSFKLVYPNFKDIPMGMRERFEEIVEISRRAEFGEAQIRLTDFGQSYCLLRDRGFLSVTTPDFRLLACCSLVPYGKSYRIESFEISHVSGILTGIYDEFSGMIGYPCKSYLSVCPISLETKHANAHSRCG